MVGLDKEEIVSTCTDVVSLTVEGKKKNIKNKKSICPIAPTLLFGGKEKRRPGGKRRGEGS